MGATALEDAVVCDGQFITSRGMGTSIEFGLALLEKFTDKKTAQDMGAKIVYNL